VLLAVGTLTGSMAPGDVADLTPVVTIGAALFGGCASGSRLGPAVAGSSSASPSA
jgi:hypothetical protein